MVRRSQIHDEPGDVGLSLAYGRGCRKASVTGVREEGHEMMRSTLQGCRRITWAEYIRYLAQSIHAPDGRHCLKQLIDYEFIFYRLKS